jgi:hypothetical protein
MSNLFNEEEESIDDLSEEEFIEALKSDDDEIEEDKLPEYRYEIKNKILSIYIEKDTDSWDYEIINNDIIFEALEEHDFRDSCEEQETNHICNITLSKIVSCIANRENLDVIF